MQLIFVHRSRSLAKYCFKISLKKKNLSTQFLHKPFHKPFYTIILSVNKDHLNLFFQKIKE